MVKSLTCFTFLKVIFPLPWKRANVYRLGKIINHFYYRYNIEIDDWKRKAWQKWIYFQKIYINQQKNIQQANLDERTMESHEVFVKVNALKWPTLVRLRPGHSNNKSKKQKQNKAHSSS